MNLVLTKKCANVASGLVTSALNSLKTLVKDPRTAMLLVLLTLVSVNVLADDSGVDLSAGTTALSGVTDGLKSYIPYVTNVCYILAGIVVVVGAVTTFIAMNNGEQDIKKRIMLIVGSCVFLVAAAKFLPMFFGIGS